MTERSDVDIEATTMRGPVLIAGLERSGTSLIYALLASHPNISMTRRTNWWRRFDDAYGDLAEDANLDRCLAAMRDYKRHRKLEPDFDRLRADFMRGPREYGRLYDLLQRQRAERLGKPRWGDKSLHTERYAARVFESFPDARIIHMVRDPRDRFASALKRWPDLRGEVGMATEMWVSSMDLAERNVAAYPHRYRQLRYEDLVTDPQGELRALSEFIDEPYVEAMLGLTGDEGFREKGSNSSYGAFDVGSISVSSIGTFRQMLSRAQIAYIEGRAGGRMERLGYEPDDIRLQGPERVRFGLGYRPRQFAMASRWHLLERLGRPQSIRPHHAREPGR